MFKRLWWRFVKAVQKELGIDISEFALIKLYFHAWFITGRKPKYVGKQLETKDGYFISFGNKKAIYTVSKRLFGDGYEVDMMPVSYMFSRNQLLMHENRVKNKLGKWENFEDLDDLIKFCALAINT